MLPWPFILGTTLQKRCIGKLDGLALLAPTMHFSTAFFILICQPVDAMQAPSYSQVVSWPGTMVAI